jgi:ribosomal protein S26
MGKAKLPTPKAVTRMGFKSLIESDNASKLRNWRIDHEYESFRIPWLTTHHYLPDFVLHNGIIIEIKGKFVAADRRKHLEVRKQHPDLDIRFVFQRPMNKLYKKSKTTYGEWADKNGYKWAERWIPKEWTEEPDNEASLAAIKALKKGGHRVT